jgi:ribosomal protein S18 acetylase RimI-like enzyme
MAFMAACFVSCLMINELNGFSPPKSLKNHELQCDRPFISIAEVRLKSQQNLIPLSSIAETEKVSFLDSSDSFRTCIDEEGILRSDRKDSESSYVLCIAEEDDLPDISKLTVDAFGADSITLSGDLSLLEKSFLQPGVGMWNAYSGAVAFAEVLSGLRKRMRRRLQGIESPLSPPSITDIHDKEAEDIAAQSSLILVLARAAAKPEDGMSIDAIATVELRLQPTDAKIPFSEPWFDRIERRGAKLLGLESSVKDKDLQPYLSNLCVDERVRGRRIGKAMVRCLEKLAKDSWGYDKLYLHVDLDNIAALNLYRTEEYYDVGLRWNPFWAGKASEIGYFVKTLN